MGLRVLLLSLLFSYFCVKSSSEDVTVTVKGVVSIAKTDDNFVCATMDWWPPAKCNYNQCPWGNASIINLDLDDPILSKAVKAFNPLRIRLGGSLQDQVLYKVGNSVSKCPSFKNSTDGLFGFTKGCLTMERWDKLSSFFNNTGAIVTFGLNALFGRKKVTDNGLWGGPWDPTNARDLINYTISKGYKIDSFEFGNELSGGGVSARVDATLYGQDMVVLKNLIQTLYQNSTRQPQVLGPGGFFDQKWYIEFLQASGPNVVDGVTHHVYNLGPGVDPNLIYKIQDPNYLDQIAQTYKDIEVTLSSVAPWSSPWVGESGGAYNSGGKNVSHAFVDSFWYLDQFGLSSTFGNKVFCRQSLIGGNYGLLNTTTFVPNPDYYSALLWHRLVGNKVLSTSHNGSPYLRAYSHCSKKKPGVTLLLINLSNSTSFNISIASDLNIYPPEDTKMEEGEYVGLREEYHLTPKDGNLESTTMLLNGFPLELTECGGIPDLNPMLLDASVPLNMAPLSISFVTLKDFKAPACS
ncbi:heparanase-like protein 1 [Tasmannia lanceolata]|uniref:heparanase-like protein 1 n=1 Tax=Tasmannia lanceolata TaxID=3420 RepID=UPI004064AD06